ncbi:hypothetical protein RIF29_28759 [Crotalaria pallida]|uniref:Uncharacterized protein n=1 Tax=Crotalaria pallida TaxID=3830 RepID=A0AAN9EFF3_CROPI
MMNRSSRRQISYAEHQLPESCSDEESTTEGWMGDRTVVSADELNASIASVSTSSYFKECSTNNSSRPGYGRIHYDSNVYVNELVIRMKMKRLRKLWRKIKREKRRFFCSSQVVHVQYDPNSYLKNFDDGFSTDPDNVFASFSARFAAPLKIF